MHPTDQILDDFGLGRLDEPATEAVSQHLESCPTCRRRVAEVTSDTFLDHFRGAGTGSFPPTWGGPPSAEAPLIDTDPGGPSSSREDTLPQIPGYQVLTCLGDGGQGSAYLVRDPGLGRLFVLKRYRVRGTVVEQEGQALARVRSRHTAQCYGLERQGDEIFLVMEYIPGNDLAEVRKKRTVGIGEVVRLVEQVAEGLEVVHACGLVHRDIKPSNIVVGDDGVARLVDFGLAAHQVFRVCLSSSLRVSSAIGRGMGGSPLRRLYRVNGQGASVIKRISDSGH